MPASALRAPASSDEKGLGGGSCLPNLASSLPAEVLASAEDGGNIALRSSNLLQGVAVEPVFWLAMLSNAATLGIAAAVFIPLSRAAARRLRAPAAGADRLQTLEAELEATQARLSHTEERLLFLERLLESGRAAGSLSSEAGPRPAQPSNRSLGAEPRA